MNKLLIILLLVSVGSSEAWPQTDTTITRYHIDVLRLDSFYLVRVDSVFSLNSPRPQVYVTHTLFLDTAALRQFILGERQIFAQMDAQRIELTKAYSRANYLTQRLECLMDSVFYNLPCVGIGSRVAGPPLQDPSISPAKSPPLKREKAVGRKQGNKKQK